MKKVVLITDLDNTIYNFMDYFAPTFRGMVHALSSKLNVEEEVLIDQFKTIFKKYNSIEYPFSVQELPINKNKSDEEIAEIIKVARGAYNRVRNKNFEPYPYVKETLNYLHKSGVLIIAVTNAPYFHALMRLKALRIDQHYDAIVCWEGYPIPDDNYTKDFLRKVNKTKYQTKIKKVWKLPKKELKPNLDGYKQVLNFYSVSPQNTYIIGDSISKDVKPAIELGAVGIWAKYGMEIKEKNLQTVLRITNWTNDKVKKIYKDGSIEPELIINNFAEIKEIIKPPQLSLNF